jgi:glycogen operon protein
MYLDGSDDPDRAPDGSLLLDDDFLLLMNAWWGPLEFRVPALRPAQRWTTVLSTYDPGEIGDGGAGAGALVSVGPRSLLVLRSSGDR